MAGMKRIALAAAVLVAFAAPLAACTGPGGTVDAGDDDDDDDDDGPGPITDADVAALCRIYTRGYVQLVRTLAVPASLAFSRCTLDDVDEAMDDAPIDDGALDESCVPGSVIYDEFARAKAGGRVAFDVARIEACAAAYDEDDAALQIDVDGTGPPGPSELPAACTDLLEPLAQEGDACTQGWDCVEGLFCQAEPLDAPSLRCLPPAPVGGACLSATGFENGAIRVCGDAASCVDGECVAYGTLNAPCGAAGCGDDLYCDGAMCRARGGVDDPCASDDACGDDLYCDADDVCRPMQAAGEACDPLAHGCEGVCVVCRPETAGGATKCLVRSDVGGPCATLADCRHGTYCGDDGVCVAGGTAGDACGQDDECADDFECDFTDGGACAAIPPPGETGDPCVVDGDCDEELACVAGECGPFPENGVACSASGACADGFCGDDGRCAPFAEEDAACGQGDVCRPPAFCDDGVCAPPRAAGAACSGDAQCVSGTCLEGGTCAAVGTSCWSSGPVFPLVVVFATLVPRRRRLC